MQRIIFIIFLLITSTVFAQEHHYWTSQFGSRSALMGGAVVGGVNDTSAGYYNPGALGFIDSSSFSVSANGYKIDRVSIENGAGTDTNLESLQTHIIPLLISGTFEFRGNKFGYSLVSKSTSTLNTSGRIEKVGDWINVNNAPLPDRHLFEGIEEYRGQHVYNSQVKEIWGGLSWAYKMMRNLSWGGSLFFALRNQSFNRVDRAHAVNQASLSSIIDYRSQYSDYWNVRGLLKLGVAAHFDPVKIGLTLTTPSFHLAGDGTTGASTEWHYFDSTRFIGDDRQEGLDAKYKTPLSLAAGVEYAVNSRTNLAATIEWFTERDRYHVLMPTSKSFFLGYGDVTPIDSAALLEVIDSARSVTNLALAVEHRLNSTYRGYLSIRTDFTSFDDNREMGINNWDIYHLTLGVIKKREESELAVGLSYSYGYQHDFEQVSNIRPENFSPETSFNYKFLGDTHLTTADYDALSLLIGYTYFFE